ncbi:MAG TPA: UDP-N-acetylmuramoyl-L-alanine--D-glutamate ligase [Candidatus Saccharimonadales bacterium]|nr:UDP-N-acetylmuramoyl-L-alanine--D-glutamate ligase [Candidatus Saccharimonadales bacterium]
MDVKGKRVLVVGLGKSGVASALFLASRGARVTVSDAKSEDQLRTEIPALLDRGITVETGKHGERTFRDQDLIVVSPGVPGNVDPLQHARRLGIPVIGEIELTARFLQGNIVAITGSNGKTTTTTLTGEIIASGGRKTLVGGNIGTPAITFVEQSSADTWVVLEISSFQLESIETFRPHISAILNVTPDHLDRHGSMENYIAAKTRIFENQTADDFAILNSDNEICRGLAAGLKPQVLWFSRQHSVERGAFVQGSKIVYRNGSEVEIMPVSEIALKGAHNVENVLAAVAIGMAAGVEPSSIRRAVKDFRAVEHRLEYVATLRGVQYYNDSKATNVDATIKALESFPANIHLILGGKDKGNDYSELAPLIAERVKRVYTIGAAAAKIESQIGTAVPVISAQTLESAVRKAADLATEGDIVLLAPACASFDQFPNYEERGKVFKELVQSLAALHSESPTGGR